MLEETAEIVGVKSYFVCCNVARMVISLCEYVIALIQRCQTEFLFCMYAIVRSQIVHHYSTVLYNMLQLWLKVK